jgi:hypothetical protein
MLKMPKKEVLEMCEEAIRQQLGKIDDLPYEVVNTVANVYYKFFEHSFDALQRHDKTPGGWTPREVKRESDIALGMESFIKNTARLTSDYNAMPKMISAIREVDKYEQPNAYKFCIEFFLDNLKYNIENAHKKNGLRRMLERKIIKNKVTEIPNLIDLLDV